MTYLYNMRKWSIRLLAIVKCETLLSLCTLKSLIFFMLLFYTWDVVLWYYKDKKWGMKMSKIKKKPIHISVDEDLKEQAELLFNDLGLNMTSAINVFLRQAVNEQAIPFEIRKINSETLQALKEVENRK